MESTDSLQLPVRAQAQTNESTAASGSESAAGNVETLVGARDVACRYQNTNLEPSDKTAMATHMGAGECMVPKGKRKRCEPSERSGSAESAEETPVAAEAHLKPPDIPGEYGGCSFKHGCAFFSYLSLRIHALHSQGLVCLL